MSLAKRDTAYHTYAEYLSWPGDLRYELIDGAAYLMSPAPLRVHQEIVGEIYFQVRAALEGKPCRAYVAPFDVRLPKADEADERIDTVVQPDLLVVCDESKLDERGMRGAPDWIVEVLSQSTAVHDQTIKLAAYERAGVREVWLVHPTDRSVTVYRLRDRVFGRPAILEMKGMLAVEVIPGLGVDWDRVAPA
ncbi:MAG: Uma2 family endonuclease [Betaproteobacteria bacterium]|nr:Uma2 family endonuclease [Betaproteobacteria bacterium]